MNQGWEQGSPSWCRDFRHKEFRHRLAPAAPKFKLIDRPLTSLWHCLTSTPGQGLSIALYNLPYFLDRQQRTAACPVVIVYK